MFSPRGTKEKFGGLNWCSNSLTLRRADMAGRRLFLAFITVASILALASGGEEGTPGTSVIQRGIQN